jgi:vancomycin resistance protein YoaR
MKSKITPHSDQGADRGIRHGRVRSVVHGSTFALLAITALGTWGIQVALAGKVAPNTFGLNANLSFEDAATVQEDFSEALDAYELQLITIEYRGQNYTFTLEELGITLQKTESVESIPITTTAVSPWSWEGGLFGEKQVVAMFDLDSEKLQQGLAAKIVNLELAVQEPQVVWNAVSEDFEVLPEQSGWSPDLDTFTVELGTAIETLSAPTLKLASIDQDPALTASDLESQTDTLSTRLTQPTTLFTTISSWDISWLDHLDWLRFESALQTTVAGQTVILNPESLSQEALASPATSADLTPTLRFKVDPAAFRSYITETIAPDVETQPQDVTITQDENGLISFEGTAVDGTQIQVDVLTELVEEALNRSWTQVELPLEFTPGKVNAPAFLREQGITELVATGYSTYDGSPTNRRHNIATGIARFDGVLVQPGEEFSFGDQLGVVDASTGYKQELVIKEEGTIPEYGGGICQVSSTLFRAILFAGLPIVERHPHSYAVTYYAYPMGWGLDATVYPPQVDLVFKNDMATPILVQAYVDAENSSAYFKFYGTKDGRTVSMDGPYISNRVGAPPAIYIVTPDLPAGTIVKKDSAHNGFTAQWTRTVTYPSGHPLYPDGATLEESIVSPYRAWPAKYAVGEGTEGYDEEV